MKLAQKRQTRQKKLVYKILKSLYQLKLAKKLQIKTIIKFFKNIDFNLINGDSYIFVFGKTKQLIIIEVYIDNFILAINQNKVIQWIKKQLFDEFNIKD